LTDGEMQQIVEQIVSLRTPLKVNGFINGKTVFITRDNPEDNGRVIRFHPLRLT
jgi:type I restriction enzyme, R subunit